MLSEIFLQHGNGNNCVTMDLHKFSLDEIPSVLLKKVSNFIYIGRRWVSKVVVIIYLLFKQSYSDKQLAITKREMGGVSPQ